MNRDGTILLADDSEDDILLTRIAFEKAGMKNPLQEVHNGEEAIAYLKGEPPYNDRARFPLPTILLMDLNMPRKNGCEVLLWLRAQKGLRRLPVVILSASMRVEDVTKAFDSGANSFLLKPSSLSELVSTIEALGNWMKFNYFPSLTDDA
jgi:CheY-like chemotaxis protein